MNRIISILIIVLSLIWIYSNAELYYHYTGLLYAFRLADWIIFIEILLAFLNIYMSIKLFIGALTIKKAIIFFGTSIFIGFIIQIKYMMF